MLEAPLKIPFFSPAIAHRILCLTVGLIFVTHGAMRIYAGTVNDFGGFLGGRGLAYGVAIAWAITFFEVIGGGCLALGRSTRVLGIAFMVHQLMAILLLHGRTGWFVVGHATGGMEYSVLLIAASIAIAAQDRGK
jgi:putative oxidoreductase